jgi:hypothetical protein
MERSKEYIILTRCRGGPEQLLQPQRREVGGIVRGAGWVGRGRGARAAAHHPGRVPVHSHSSLLRTTGRRVEEG